MGRFFLKQEKKVVNTFKKAKILPNKPPKKTWKFGTLVYIMGTIKYKCPSKFN